MSALTVLDEREIWHGPLCDAARRRGYDAVRIRRGSEAAGRTGLGFLRPHAVPKILEQNHADWWQMSHLTMVQDFAQVEVYEDKSTQFFRWGKWMPRTWRFENREQAIDFVASYHGTLVSKADVGASSYNVRVLQTQADQLGHVRQLFGQGVRVDHCAGGPGGQSVQSVQRGYALLQEYIPHDVTYRVNAVGRARAIFKRYNKPGTLTAQTGNVDGIVELDDRLESLLRFANVIFEEIGTRWCALDILERGHEWVLLETSLAWPWPSPGNCMQARFFGTDRRWAEMWDVLLDEYEAGVWG